MPTHTYQSVTVADRTFTPVSDITPVTGDVEDKFTWVNTYPNYDTWIELGAREHWCDWYFATAWVDTYSSLTTPIKTYTGVTKSDNAYSPITTPTKTYKEVTV